MMPVLNQPDSNSVALRESDYTESALLTAIVQLLEPHEKQPRLLSDLGGSLSDGHRRAVKESSGRLRTWLLKYPSIFVVTGPQGKESATLSNYQFHPGNTMAGSVTLPAEDVKDLPKGARSTNVEDDAAVQLRGLPYKATEADIMEFLGDHKEFLAGENPIHIMQNKEGRASGFAKVQFVSPERAKAVCDCLHNTNMELPVCGDPTVAVNARYIEIFPFSERANKPRFRKSIANEASASSDGRPAATKEEVLEECRNHMNMPERSVLLLSMLGVALSAGAHAYLKKTEQGLMHFLAQFPDEFVIDGAKGSESVKYLNLQPLSPACTPYSYMATPSPNPYYHANAPTQLEPIVHTMTAMSQSASIVPGGRHGCVHPGLNNLNWSMNLNGVQDAMTIQPSQLWISGSGVYGGSGFVNSIFNVDTSLSTNREASNPSAPALTPFPKPVGSDLEPIDLSRLCLGKALEMM